MAQFDVYENLNVHTKNDIPYLLDLQADLLSTLATRIVAPLVGASAMGKPISHLNPKVPNQTKVSRVRPHFDVIIFSRKRSLVLVSKRKTLDV